ncbi:hypothetical protein YC2023_053151 [Brassica napus]
MKKTQVLALALLRRKCRLVTGVVVGSHSFGLNWYENSFNVTYQILEWTPEATTRGCIESDFESITDFLMKATHITSALQRKHG